MKIPSVEPMIVPRVQVQQGSGPVSIDSTFINLKVNGISNYKITNAKTDFSKGLLEFGVDIPYLFMEGDYEIRGRVLVLPIVGQGDSWSNYSKCVTINFFLCSKFSKTKFRAKIKNCSVKTFHYFFLAGVSGVMTLKMKPIEKGGETFLNLEKLSFDVKVQRAQINMDNLFNGNKELGKF